MFDESGGLIAALAHQNHRSVLESRVYPAILADGDVLRVAQVGIVGYASSVDKQFGVDVIGETGIKRIAREFGSRVLTIVFVPQSALVEDPASETQQEGQAELEKLRYHFTNYVDSYY